MQAVGESANAEMADGASVHPVYGRLRTRVRCGSHLWRLLSEAPCCCPRYPAGSIIVSCKASRKQPARCHDPGLRSAPVSRLRCSS